MAAQATALVLDKATLLGFSYNAERLGSQFRFGVRKTIQVTAGAISLGTAEGEIGTQVQALDALVDTGDYVPVTVNGEKLTEKGKLLNFSLKEGPQPNWTRWSEASFTIEIFEEGDISNASGDDYAGFADSGPIDSATAQFLEEFTEEFSFSKAANSIDYNHTINLKLSDEVEGLPLGPNKNAVTADSAVTTALEIARQLLEDENRPAFDWLNALDFQNLYSSTGKTYKKLITETIDTINNTVSVSESFKAANLKEGRSYSFEATQTLEITENGVINVAESGTVTGLLKDGENPWKAMPEVYFDIELNNAIKPDGRLQKMFDYYKESEALDICEDKTVPDLKLDDNGDVVLTEKGVTRNEFTGEISYTVKGTNDEKVGKDFSHSYTRIIKALQYQGTDQDISTRPYLQISQDGSFVGNGPTEEDGHDAPSYPKALEAWNDNKTEIKSLLKASIGADGIYPVSLSNRHSFKKGEVGYRIEYSNHPQYPADTLQYKKLTFNRTVVDPETTQARYLYQHNIETVINHPDKTQLIQKRTTRELPSSSEKCSMVGKRKATLETLTTQLKSAKDEGGQDEVIGPNNEHCSFLKDCSYTFNADNDKILNITFNWN